MVAEDPPSSSGGLGEVVRIFLVGLAGVFFLALVIAAAVSLHSLSNVDDDPNDANVSTAKKAIQAICQPTDYRQTCISSLTKAAGNTSEPRELIRTGFQVAEQQIREAIKNSSIVKELAHDQTAKDAIDVCEALLHCAIDDLHTSFERLGEFDLSKLNEYIADLNVWLSGAVTYQESCLDAFENTTGDAGKKMKKILKSSQELTSNGLAMVTEIQSLLGSLDISGIGRERRLLFEERRNWGFPSWVDRRRRSLLNTATAATVQPNVIVAQDGSGKYKTVNEALKDIPLKDNDNNIFIIYIKAGIYKEKVILDKKMINVMMIGDGPTKTVITGSLNFVDGTRTCNTSTFTAEAKNFMAKDMGFENSAGAQKHQAVALRVTSDMSVFYNCQMDGYQDTLYAHTHRQFYRDCTISGTIDFIFGDAPAVFQNCRIIVRKPLANQQCIVTASGRIERRSASAIILQNCTITGDPAYLPVMDANKAYLGRPWKNFSRTIIMQSYIDKLIAPEGWLPWQGDVYLNTLFYTEYQNRGPGANQAGRVTWKGIKHVTSQHIHDFTPKTFFKGDDWITATRVPYSPGMIAV